MPLLHSLLNTCFCMPQSITLKRFSLVSNSLYSDIRRQCRDRIISDSYKCRIHEHYNHQNEECTKYQYKLPSQSFNFNSHRHSNIQILEIISFLIYLFINIHVLSVISWLHCIGLLVLYGRIVVIGHVWMSATKTAVSKHI